MISRGVEISIAGCVGEMVRVLLSGLFFFFFFSLFYYLFKVQSLFTRRYADKKPPLPPDPPKAPLPILQISENKQRRIKGNHSPSSLPVSR